MRDEDCGTSRDWAALEHPLATRARAAAPALAHALSLAGVIAQDVDLFVLSGAARQAEPMAFALQGLVLLVAIGLVGLSRKASSQGWIK